MTNERFNNILAHNQELMLSEDFNRKVNQHGSSYAKGGNSGGSDLSSLESQVFGTTTQQKPIQKIQVINENRDLSNSKLPKAILESFKKTPAMSGDNFPQPDSSSSTMQFFNSKQGQTLMEAKPTVIPQQTVTSNPSIDYSLIKSLIDESIRRNLEELKKTTLNESVQPSMRGMRFVDGNKIQFVDSKGNLYEGVLKLKKRKQ